MYFVAFHLCWLYLNLSLHDSFYTSNNYKLHSELLPIIGSLTIVFKTKLDTTYINHQSIYVTVLKVQKLTVSNSRNSSTNCCCNILLKHPNLGRHKRQIPVNFTKALYQIKKSPWNQHAGMTLVCHRDVFRYTTKTLRKKSRNVTEWR